jgi:hypothetical protein
VNKLYRLCSETDDTALTGVTVTKPKSCLNSEKYKILPKAEYFKTSKAPVDLTAADYLKTEVSLEGAGDK